MEVALPKSARLAVGARSRGVTRKADEGDRPRAVQVQAVIYLIFVEEIIRSEAKPIQNIIV